MADKKTALVADDQSINRSFVKIYLGSRGYDVDTAQDGLEAFEACKKKKYDLVFSDIEMPNMNGIEFLRSAKRLAEYKDVPFVILSTLTDESIKAKVMGLGAFYYMVKPFNEQKMNDFFSLLR